MSNNGAAADEFEGLLNEARTMECACPCHDRLPYWERASVKPTYNRCCLHIPWQAIDEERRCRRDHHPAG